MKKQTLFQLLFALLTLTYVHSSFAQISIGIRGGVLLNNMEISPSDDIDTKIATAVQIAIPVEIGISNMFAVQPEVMYGTHGFKLKESETLTEGGFTSTYEATGDLTANYLEIPVLAKLKAGSGKVKFNVLAGPSIGFGIGGKYKYDYFSRITGPDGIIIEEEDPGSETANITFLKDGFNDDDVDEDEIPFSKTSFNLHLGAGASIAVGKASIFIDARYILGLNDLLPDSEGTEDEGKIEGKSNRIGLSAGVLFPLN